MIIPIPDHFINIAGDSFKRVQHWKYVHVHEICPGDWMYLGSDGDPIGFVVCNSPVINHAGNHSLNTITVIAGNTIKNFILHKKWTVSIMNFHET